MGRPSQNQNQNQQRQFLDIPAANGISTSSSSCALTSTSRENSTRVQLQRLRLREDSGRETQNAAVVVVGQKIPGFRTSAAFFASLRTNLRLNASPPPSPLSTPPSMRASTGSLPLPSPLSSIMDSTTEATSDAAAPQDPLAGVPELQTYVAEKEEDKIAALKLVADSVAQMAQAANSSVIWHPLTLAVLIAIIAVVAQVVLRSTGQIGTAATTCTGLIMILLVLCRRISAPYVVEAEGINFEWLGEAQMIVTKFGDEIMGTVVIDWISPESKQKKKKVSKGEIKGWAVRMRYRGKGVGSALLEEAVKESQKKGAETIEFADDHANATRLFPKIFNGRFDRNEKKARELLQDLVESGSSRSKRRKGGST